MMVVGSARCGPKGTAAPDYASRPLIAPSRIGGFKAKQGVWASSDDRTRRPLWALDQGGCMISRRLALGCALALASLSATMAEASDRTSLDALIAKHAKANGVPESLVHRVVRRESNYNPRAAHRGNYGLMQIRHGTARGMGYTGSAAGLLDAETNLSYAVPYLANAYRVAGGDQSRAVSLYASGFYYVAKRRGLLGSLKKGPIGGDPAEVAQAQRAPPTLGS